MRPFDLGLPPRIVFGPGRIADLPRILAAAGAKRVLILTGGASFINTDAWSSLKDTFTRKGVVWFHDRIKGEPSPDMVDAITNRFRKESPDWVIAVGGGSVLDAGKAVSAMLPKNGSVMDYLEGFPGSLPHDGVKIPFAAAPTTAGTGSEATKNAVISQIGPEGFKRSLRHDRLVPDISVIDPERMVSCPSSVTAACGMDAFVQLLESYVSPKAGLFTDNLALTGMEQVRDWLVAACRDGDHIDARCGMAYAALMSGITLSHAGLGVVHGFASVIGGYFPAPHGAICGAMIGPATRVNIECLKSRAPQSPLLEKYAKAGSILAGHMYMPSNRRGDCLDDLVSRITAWRMELGVPGLSQFGVTRSDVGRITAAVQIKNNPVALNQDQLAEILEASLD